MGRGALGPAERGTDEGGKSETETSPPLRHYPSPPKPNPAIHAGG